MLGMKSLGRAGATRASAGFVALVVLTPLAMVIGCGVSKATTGVDAAADVVAGETGTEVMGSGGAPGTTKPASQCSFDGAAATARAVLAVAVDGAVTLVMSDGSLREAYRFMSTQSSSGTSFSIRLMPAGEDFFAVGTWWGPGDPAVPCEVINGSVSCPETDRLVRIAPTGEIVSVVTQHWIAPSSSIGSPPPLDAGAPDAAVVPPDPSGFTWVFPAGLIPMSRSIDSQGWFIAVLRDAYAADVYRSRDAMTAWTPLGKRLGQVEDVQVSNTAGTYVILARGTQSVFVPQQTWQQDPTGDRQPELVQDSTQLVRPETGVVEVLNEGGEVSVNVSQDGLCAASWEATAMGRQLVTYELTTAGSRRTFLRERIGIGGTSSLWLAPVSGRAGP